MRNENILLNALKICHREQKLTSIFIRAEREHWTGCINSFNDKEILFRHISSLGEYDGYIWYPLSSVCRIDYDGKYERKIKLLYTEKEQQHIEITGNNGSILFSLLSFANKNHLIVSVNTPETVITGLIEDFTEVYIKIKQADLHRKENNMLSVRIEQICSVFCDTLDEQVSTYLQCQPQRDQ